MPLVALDLDGTLVNQATAAREWAEGFVAYWDLSQTASADIAGALAQRRPKGEVFAALATTWSLPVTGAELWQDYRRRMPELVRCTDADANALRELRAAGWTLGIVTNGMADNQEGKIRSTGLADLVDGWVVSEAVGYRKPEARIFSALAAQLDCTLEGWMIGDSPEDDIAGGAAVGLRTALIISDDPATEDAAIRPTIIATSVADAVAVILTTATR